MICSISRVRAGWITLCGLLQLLFAAEARPGALPVQLTVPSAASGSIGGNGGRSAAVVLVHGINDSARSMSRIKRFLESRGRRAYAISLKPNNASVSFDVMARQLDTFVTATLPAGEKFDLVAFSMGGLVARYYIQKLGGYGRVRRFVTLSTPNHGTFWAWLSGRRGVKEMRPGSEMLRDLNGNAGKLVSLDYTSIYTPFDLSILPATSSRMPEARNVIAWVPLHPLMVMMPGPLHAVARALE